MGGRVGRTIEGYGRRVYYIGFVYGVYGRDGFLGFVDFSFIIRFIMCVFYRTLGKLFYKFYFRDGLGVGCFNLCF